MPKSSFSSKKFLTEEEFDELWHSCYKRRNEEWAPVLFLLALKTGARFEELRALRKSNLLRGKLGGENHYSVFIVGAKGSRDREIPLPAWLFKLLQQRPGDVLFPYHYNTVRLHWHNYRPRSEKTFHCLRHTFAMRLYREKRDIRLVRYALGHESITNTMVYLDYFYSQEELKEALA